MLRNRWSLIALACVLLSPVRSEAQTCLGQMSFAGAPLQAGAGLALSANTTNGLGAIGLGRDAWFVRGGVEFTKVSDLDGAGKGVAFQGGWSLPIVADSRVHFCPVATLVNSWGYHPFLSPAVSEFFVTVGGNVGFDLGRKGPLHLVPTLGLNLNYNRESYETTAFFHWDPYSEKYLVLQAGVGLQLNNTMSLTPTLVVPMGSETAETAFSLQFATRLR